MVAKISTGKSIRVMLLYNENKVSQGEAKLILSSGFAGDIDKMNFNQKLQCFHHLTELKPNVKTNAMHISLNFHSSEQLDNLKLQQIASAYMEKIGFGDQPFWSTAPGCPPIWLSKTPNQGTGSKSSPPNPF